MLNLQTENKKLILEMNSFLIAIKRNELFSIAQIKTILTNQFKHSTSLEKQDAIKYFINN